MFHPWSHYTINLIAPSSLATDLPTLEEHNWCRATLRLIALGGLRSLRSLRPPEAIPPEDRLRPGARKPARPSPRREALAVSDGRKERSEWNPSEDRLRPRARKPTRPSPGWEAHTVGDGRKERSEWNPSEDRLRPGARKPAHPSPGREAHTVGDGRKERSEWNPSEDRLRPRARKPTRPSPRREALAVSDGRKERSEWSPSQYYGILCSEVLTMPQTTSVDSTAKQQNNASKSQSRRDYGIPRSRRSRAKATESESSRNRKHPRRGRGGRATPSSQMPLP